MGTRPVRPAQKNGKAAYRGASCGLAPRGGGGPADTVVGPHSRAKAATAAATARRSRALLALVLLLIINLSPVEKTRMVRKGNAAPDLSLSFSSRAAPPLPRARHPPTPHTPR